MQNRMSPTRRDFPCLAGIVPLGQISYGKPGAPAAVPPARASRNPRNRILGLRNRPTGWTRRSFLLPEAPPGAPRPPDPRLPLRDQEGWTAVPFPASKDGKGVL